MANPHNNALRLAVAGATHGHVGWILGRKDKSDVSLVGVYEPDTELAQALHQTIQSQRGYLLHGPDKDA